MVSTIFLVEYFTLWPGAVGLILIQKSKFSSKYSSTKLQTYPPTSIVSRTCHDNQEMLLAGV